MALPEWILQLCLALKYCHDQNVLHGDVKSSNIFLTEAGDLKVGDFGTATNLAKTVKSVNAMTGTPLFFAPEIITGSPHSFKADVWALGVVFYQLLALQYPFFDTNFSLLLTKILEADPAPLPEAYPADLRQFVSSLLVKDEAQRPDMTQVCASPWFQDALDRFPEEREKWTNFRPQMRIRITENFLQREFDAIRVFRFSEDQGSAGTGSFRFSSTNNSLINIFQSNCMEGSDLKRTEKMLSKFARMAQELDHSRDFSDESELLDDDEFAKDQRTTKKSTSDTDKGVQIEAQCGTEKTRDLRCLGQLIRQLPKGPADFRSLEPLSPAESRVQTVPNSAKKHTKGSSCKHSNSIAHFLGRVAQPPIRHAPTPSSALGGKNLVKGTTVKALFEQTSRDTSVTELSERPRHGASFQANLFGGGHPTEWFTAIRRRQKQITSKQDSRPTISGQKSGRKVTADSTKPRQLRKAPSDTTSEPLSVLNPNHALLVRMINAGSRTLHNSEVASSPRPQATQPADRIEEARKFLIQLIQSPS